MLASRVKRTLPVVLTGVCGVRRRQIRDATGECIDKMNRIMAGSESTTIRLGCVDEQDARQRICYCHPVLPLPPSVQPVLHRSLQPITASPPPSASSSRRCMSNTVATALPVHLSPVFPVQDVFSVRATIGITFSSRPANGGVLLRHDPPVFRLQRIDRWRRCAESLRCVIRYSYGASGNHGRSATYSR
jgi:hypothetical protein